LLSNLNDIDDLRLSFTIGVIDEDAKIRTRLATQLGEVASPLSYASIEALLDALDLQEPAPIVAVFGPSFAGPSGLAQLSEVIRDRPEMSAVLVVEELSTQLLQQAIRAGVSDVITIPTDTAQLVEAVDRAAANLSSLPAVPAAPPIVPAGEPGSALGRMVTVFSTKGGAGKSMVATNVAVTLAKQAERPVCLVDCDLQFADDAVMLKLVPQHTIVDAVGSLNRLDVPLLRSLLIRHEPSGLLVLAGPTEPAFADQISADDVMKIIDTLREFCAYVVVDTPSHFTEVVIRVLEESDDIILVAGMDVPNIKNVKLGLQTLRLLSVPISKVKLVLNRANSKVKIDVSEVERALQIRADCLIPSDISVPQSVNKGVPVVLDAPKSGVARSLLQLSEMIATSEPSRGKR
jgi:pilus assembly protein CpaE